MITEEVTTKVLEVVCKDAKGRKILAKELEYLTETGFPSCAAAGAFPPLSAKVLGVCYWRQREFGGEEKSLCELQI